MSYTEKLLEKVLGKIPPRLVIGAYREILGNICLSIPAKYERETFTMEELEHEIMDFALTLEPGHPYRSECERCLRILPEVMQKLLETELLKQVKGQYVKSQHLDNFRFIAKQVRSGAERAIRWGVYYLIENGKSWFSVSDLIDVIEVSKREMEDALKRLAIRIDDNWISVVNRKDEKWTINEKLELVSQPPTLNRDVSDKLLFALAIFARSNKTEFTSDEMLEAIQNTDAEAAERFLKKLHFSESDGMWTPSVDVLKKPTSLIEKIESPLRLQKGQVDYVCLHLLDRGSFSLSELSELFEWGKSTVSRALNRLSKENLIVLTGKGRFGELYYVTNCNKCPFGKDKEECRSELKNDIASACKDLGLPIPKLEWKSYSNQSLRNLLIELSLSKTRKTAKADVQQTFDLYRKLFKPSLLKILEALEVRVKKMISESDWIAWSKILSCVDEYEKGLPFLYLLGARQTLESELITKALESLSKKYQTQQ